MKLLAILLLVGAATALPTGVEKRAIDLNLLNNEDDLLKLKLLLGIDLGKRSADLEDVEARFVGNIGDGDMMSAVIAYLSAAAGLVGRSGDVESFELEKRAEPQEPAADSTSDSSVWERFVLNVFGPMADKYGPKLAEALFKAKSNMQIQ